VFLLPFVLARDTDTDMDTDTGYRSPTNVVIRHGMTMAMGQILYPVLGIK
jgi:hypothetical protein